jgi:tetratricopeptide (TPR) repeat protein
MSHRGRKPGILVALLGAPALLGAMYPLQKEIDKRIKPFEQEPERLLIRSGPVLKKLSLGYDSLLANIYWTRAVQYYGRNLETQGSNLELLAPLLDLTTTLDPQLLVAYRFGAFFMAEPPPIGAGRPDLAAELVRRGIAANPEEWRLWSDLGFIYYWHLKDYQQASNAYLEGSKHPGAALWMKGMAAKIAEEGGSRQTSRLLWGQIYESTADANVRRDALGHLQALKAEEDVELLEELVAQFRRRLGRPPSSFQDLVAARMLGGLPRDPSGSPYVLDSDGRVRLSPSSKISSQVLKPIFHR